MGKKKNIWISKNWEKSEEITADCDAHSEERRETPEKNKRFLYLIICARYFGLKYKPSTVAKTRSVLF